MIQMDFIIVIFIALALAMDSFAVSITSGVTIKKLKVGNALKIALLFGFFQGFMPVIGWLAGTSLRTFISGFDHWVAYGLLSFIGLKMIYESFKLESAEKEGKLNSYVLLVLAIVTSIDALAVGISFAFLKIAIITPVIVIGIITFLLSFIGVFIGNKIGPFFENKVEFLGGLILVAIGVRILIEHLI